MPPTGIRPKQLHTTPILPLPVLSHLVCPPPPLPLSYCVGAAQGGGAPAIRLLDVLWKMADDKSAYRPRIRATAVESILPVAGLRGLGGHRALTLKRCVENVEEGRAVVTSLKVQYCLTATPRTRFRDVSVRRECLWSGRRDVLLVCVFVMLSQHHEHYIVYLYISLLPCCILHLTHKTFSAVCLPGWLPICICDSTSFSAQIRG